MYNMTMVILKIFSSLYREQFNEKFKFLTRFFKTRTPATSWATNVSQQEQLQQQNGRNITVNRRIIPKAKDMSPARSLPNHIN